MTRDTSILRADRLVTLRKQRGWSQREFARECGFGSSLINKYETGHYDPTATNLQIMAEKLDVSVDYLLGTTDEPRGHFGSEALREDEKAVLQALRGEGWLGVIRLATEKLAK